MSFVKPVWEKREINGWKGKKWGIGKKVFLPAATHKDVEDGVEEFLRRGKRIKNLEYSGPHECYENLFFDVYSEENEL